MRLDLTGNQFGKLTALKDVGADKRKNRLWLCQCTCGNTRVTTVTILQRTSGSLKSCGCNKGFGGGLPEGESSFRALYGVYKRRAKRKGHKFDLSKDEFRELTSQSCHYCGISPVQKNKATKCSNGVYLYNGVDRIDNSKGYTLSNCVPCCGYCNVCKNDHTQEEFLDHITKIYESCIMRR